MHIGRGIGDSSGGDHVPKEDRMRWRGYPICSSPTKGHGYTRTEGAGDDNPAPDAPRGEDGVSRSPGAGVRGNGLRPGGRTSCSSASRIAPGASWSSPKKKRGCSTTTTSAPSTSCSV